MLIPTGGNVYTASVYMNYVYDPKVQALMVAGDPEKKIVGIYYIPPVIGAKAAGPQVQPLCREQPARSSRRRRCSTTSTSSIPRP